MKLTYTKKFMAAVHDRYPDLHTSVVGHEHEQTGLKVFNFGPCISVLNMQYTLEKKRAILKTHRWIPTDFITARSTNIPGMRNLYVSTGCYG